MRTLTERESLEMTAVTAAGFGCTKEHVAALTKLAGLAEKFSAAFTAALEDKEDCVTRFEKAMQQLEACPDEEITAELLKLQQAVKEIRRETAAMAQLNAAIEQYLRLKQS